MLKLSNKKIQVLVNFIVVDKHTLKYNLRILFIFRCWEMIDAQYSRVLMPWLVKEPLIVNITAAHISNKILLDWQQPFMHCWMPLAEPLFSAYDVAVPTMGATTCFWVHPAGGRWPSTGAHGDRAGNFRTEECFQIHTSANCSPTGGNKGRALWGCS